MVRALASHKCGPGSNPSVDSMCGLSLLLVLCLAPRGFSPGTPVPPPPQKKTRHFQIPVTPVMVVKRFSIFFFSNGRITFIKFEGCFLKGQIHSNGFKIPKCCIVKCLNFIVPFEKKKTWDSFLFRKRFDWTIFFQEAWFQCPYCKSLFMVI